MSGWLKIHSYEAPATKSFGTLATGTGKSRFSWHPLQSAHTKWYYRLYTTAPITTLSSTWDWAKSVNWHGGSRSNGEASWAMAVCAIITNRQNKRVRLNIFIGGSRQIGSTKLTYSTLIYNMLHLYIGKSPTYLGGWMVIRLGILLLNICDKCTRYSDLLWYCIKK